VHVGRLLHQRQHPKIRQRQLERSAHRAVNAQAEISCYRHRDRRKCPGTEPWELTYSVLTGREVGAGGR